MAVVAGLGIYADWAGVVGTALREGIGLLVGWVRLAVPFALVFVGIALIRGRAPAERIRLALGFALLTISATGLLELALGPGQWDAALDEFRDAGGVLGAAAALPMQRVLATAGATLVLSRRRLGRCAHPHPSDAPGARVRRRERSATGARGGETRRRFGFNALG